MPAFVTLNAIVRVGSDENLESVKASSEGLPAVTLTAATVGATRRPRGCGSGRYADQADISYRACRLKTARAAVGRFPYSVEQSLR